MAQYLTFNAGFKVAGAKSFRLSSHKLLNTTDEKGYGDNAQNQADESRRCFIPRNGNRFAQADLEGAEAVAVALLVREGMFRDLVRLKIKPHNFVCIHLFPDKFAEYLSPSFIDGMTPTTLRSHADYLQIVKLCKKLKREYDLAKRTVHGSNYSMGWKTLRDTVLKETRGAIVLSAREAKRLLEIYFELFPEIKEYQLQIEELCKQHAVIKNLFGHEAQFIGRFTTSLARTMISWAPQSTVGQCTNIAAHRYQTYIEQFDKRDWHLHPIVHDSILTEAPVADTQENIIALRDAMSFEFESPIDGWRCGIGVEVQLGDNWGKYDEEENPNGLKVVTE